MKVLVVGEDEDDVWLLRSFPISSYPASHARAAYEAQA